jgi:glycosyltransferase involved in cell wall biosynthesis
MNGPPVFFLPVVDWSFRVQRPQHLARCFARAGYRVFYPDLRFAPVPPPPRLVESGIWRLALEGDPGHDPYRDRLPGDAVARAVAGLRAMAAEHPLDGCWIVAQLPSWRPLAEAIRTAFAGRLLFDCVDEYAAFRDHAALADDEADLARGADLVVAVSEPLRAKLAGLGASRAVVVRNGCDPEHFGPAAGRARGDGPPVAGFFGGIHDWFDASLLAAVARVRPGWQFWLIGDTYLGDVEPLQGLANVRFLGELPYADLPRVVSHFDAGIIPFKLTPLTRVVETVKVYEMLAAGLPVVATALPELRRLAPMVAIANGVDDFAACLDAALATPASARAARRELARSHSWLERFLLLQRLMTAVAEGECAEVEVAARARVSEAARAPEAAGVAAPMPAVAAVPPARRSTSYRVDRYWLGLFAPAPAAAERGEPMSRGEQLAGLEAERLSLVAQRDRVQVEAARLAGELERVERERLALERELCRVTSSRWWRLAAPLRALRQRLRA